MGKLAATINVSQIRDHTYIDSADEKSCAAGTEPRLAASHCIFSQHSLNIYNIYIILIGRLGMSEQIGSVCHDSKMYSGNAWLESRPNAG
jgi:hypothetical protein